MDRDSAASPIRVLTFSTLFPNAVNPSHGIFVETRLRHLLRSGRVDARVVAPVPWFPSTNARYGRYAAFARVPAAEVRHGIAILHPRYPVLPKIGMALAPLLLARAAQPVIERMIRGGYDFDVLDAHFFYPDGVAAAMLGRSLNKPVVITARGSDLNLLPRHRLPRWMIQWASRQAAAVVTVSAALKDVLLGLGTAPERVQVLRNGVDLELVHPVERAAHRLGPGLNGRTLLSVGNLIPLKGHDLAIRALRLMPEVELRIAGDGPDRQSLEALAAQVGVASRVRFLGKLSQPELRDYYGTADALVLASSREGWANVLLESMACGTPVIATAVGGTPEVVTAPEAGVLMKERTAEALAAAARHLFLQEPDRAATRRYAERFDWDATTRGQLALFERIAGERRRHFSRDGERAPT